MTFRRLLLFFVLFLLVIPVQSAPQKPRPKPRPKAPPIDISKLPCSIEVDRKPKPEREAQPDPRPAPAENKPVRGPKRPQPVDSGHEFKKQPVDVYTEEVSFLKSFHLKTPKIC